MQATAQPKSERARVNPRRIEHLAHAIVDTHSHFRRRAALFEFSYREEVLVVRGSVPSFYLKQVLQAALRDLKGVHRIDNQVTVVSCEDVSSAGRLTDGRMTKVAG